MTKKTVRPERLAEMHADINEALRNSVRAGESTGDPLRDESILLGYGPSIGPGSYYRKRVTLDRLLAEKRGELALFALVLSRPPREGKTIFEEEMPAKDRRKLYSMRLGVISGDRMIYHEGDAANACIPTEEHAFTDGMYYASLKGDSIAPLTFIDSDAGDSHDYGNGYPFACIMYGEQSPSHHLHNTGYHLAIGNDAVNDWVRAAYRSWSLKAALQALQLSHERLAGSDSAALPALQEIMDAERWLRRKTIDFRKRECKSALGCEKTLDVPTERVISNPGDD